MELIGGILGQIIATLNVVVLVAAHLFVILHDQKLKKIERQKATAVKQRKLHETLHKKK